MEYNHVKEDKMNINVQLFSPLKEFAGILHLQVTLPEPSSAEDLIARLAAQYPAILPLLRNAQVVLNNEMVHRLHLLKDGDEVQLRVPMFGG